MGLNFYDLFCSADGETRISYMAEHLARMVNAGGSEFANIGTDFDGFDGVEILEIEKAEEMERLWEALKAKGFTEAQIGKSFVLHMEIKKEFFRLYSPKNSLICPAIIFINFVRASILAHAIWGVIRRRLLSVKPRRGLSVRIGSSDRTSRLRARISFVSSAGKSFSTTTGPRPRFRKMALFFIFRKEERSIRFLVCSFNGACTDTMSEVSSSVSRETWWKPSVEPLLDGEP